MKKSLVIPCPICGDDAFVSMHESLSHTTGHSVQCYIYTCEKDGWFKLSESVNELVTNNPSPAITTKLTKIVSDDYFPASLIPMESVTPLKLIESLD